jgi:hypothetical protein
MLAVHVGTSVGWMGAVAAFVAVACLGLTLTPDAVEASGVYWALDFMLTVIIVPLALLSLLSGVLQAIGTPWGLFRHYWVLLKLMLTVGATLVLLLHTGAADRAATLAHTASHQLVPLQMQLLVDSVAGLAVLIVIAVLGWAKPKGELPSRQQRHT